jgi:hypothetical protein
LENWRISIFELRVGNSGTTVRKSTALSPIPTTSKGLLFGKETLNRISIIYRVSWNFSRFFGPDYSAAKVEILYERLSG